MTKKIKILLIAVLGLVATVCISVFAGCKFNYSVDEYKEMYGLSARVTYFLNLSNGNGGQFDDSKYIKDIYYAAGDTALEVGSYNPYNGNSNLTVDPGYNFGGWYTVKLDNDGNPLYSDGTVYNEEDGYDANKGLQLDKEYDFSKTLEKDAHIFLCGSFFEDIRLKFRFFCGEGEFDVEYKTTDEDGKEVTSTFKEGEVIEGLSRIIPKTTAGVSDVTNSLSIPGYTVMGLYASMDDEEVYSGWPITYPEPDEDGEYPEAIYLYAKLLKGTYTLVRTPSDVSEMFSRVLKTNFYIMQDIDCGGLEIDYHNTYSCSIYGGSSGHTISNFVVTKSSNMRQGETASIFGTLISGAEFKNVTFENFQVKFTVMSGQEAGQINLFANKINEGVVFENFTIKDCELNITESNTLLTYLDKDSWIFGIDTLPEGVTVENAVCLVNGSDPFNEDNETINSDINKTEDQ